MKLTLEDIQEGQAWKSAWISLPSYDIKKVSENTKKAPVWVHFGIGNIFRIFIGGLADTLLSQGDADKGITCVETFDFDVADKIYRPHDNLVLAVTLKADGSTDRKVLGSLTEALKARQGSSGDWERLKEIFSNPALQMISFTITEKGYSLKDTDGDFLPLIQTDLSHGPQKPSSAMAIVCSLLYERWLSGRFPLAVVSMDNCSQNGEKLQNAILTIAREWSRNGFVKEAFLDYLSDEKQVSFPWSMIDKITPRPAASVLESLEKAGLEDMTPVVTSKGTYIAPFVNAEEPQYLVLEDTFPNGRPALEKAGVYMTDRTTVNLAERMKVTACLNPLHTALAVYGCLLGYTRISEEMKDTNLNRLAQEIGITEGLPVVENPGIISPVDFVTEVLHVRLPNPFIPDTPQRIAADTSQKVGIRYGETIKAYTAAHKNAKKLTAIPLAIAGWCRYLLGVDDCGKTFELSPDPMLPELLKLLKDIEIGKPETYTGQLKKLLSNANIFGIDLYRAGIGEKIEDMFLEEIQGEHAVRDTLKKYMG